MKPYLNSFFIYYSLLKLKFKKQDRIQIRVDLVIKIVKNLCIRLLTGISVKWYKDADYCATKLFVGYSILKGMKTTYNIYFSIVIGFFFNIYVDGLPETNKIERRKIYKTQETM